MKTSQTLSALVPSKTILLKEGCNVTGNIERNSQEEFTQEVSVTWNLLRGVRVNKVHFKFNFLINYIFNFKGFDKNVCYENENISLKIKQIRKQSINITLILQSSSGYVISNKPR